MTRLRSLLNTIMVLFVGGTITVGFLQQAACTPLDDYVAEYDPSYGYTLVGTYPQDGYTDYVVHMTSQTWLTPAEVDRRLRSARTHTMTPIRRCCR